MGPSTTYHVFSLPPELIQSLIPRTLISSPSLSKPIPSEPSEPTAKSSTPAGGSSGQRSCNVCLGITFIDVDEQRAHFRSDWHRYNTKIRLNGGVPVSEEAFGQLVNALEDSLSGSASSSSEGDSDNGSNESDRVNALVNKTKRLLRPRSTSPLDERRNAPLTALTWFHSPPSTQIGVYRALFSVETDPRGDAYLEELKKVQRGKESVGDGDGRTWALFMVAGGHFAGAIVRVSRPEEDDKGDEQEGGKGKKKHKAHKAQKPDTEVLRSKTFHRYTTRRKQGGSQSVNDNAKGAAISAGAMLRRYGEQALRDDIRNLLADWAEDIDSCERIWIRASVSNRRIFLGYEGAVIEKGDERLRTFPFPTRRPTQSELLRCLLELTRVKVTHFTEAELREQDEAYLASLPQPKPPPPIAPSEPEKSKALKAAKLTKEEEAFREKWGRLLDMVGKGRLEPLKAFWEREGGSMGGVDAAIPEWTGDRRATLLQVAAQAGHEDLTWWLLEDLHADPTISVPSYGSKIEIGVNGEEENKPEDDDVLDGLAASKGSRRTAYDLARTKAVRDVFRRCAAMHSDWWDWFGAARVPSALSREMEDERDEKKKVRKKGLKERVKEREVRDREKERESVKVDEAAEKEEEALREARKKLKEAEQSPFARKLGGGSGASNGVAGLTPEMRARVERERRARAAEARLKALQR
ncbi:hypothetical protein AX17_005332 [Amanita inopinata Kibby_2008]|nr:hypothetical protein AX17_005332 [Amanita inopinata Kibby_2008]